MESRPNELAIVSPCSQCKNQRAVPADGKPACPRQYWKQVAANQDANDPDPTLPPLTLNGNEDTVRSQSQGLINPVYSDRGHSILVWTASLSANQARFDLQSGSLLNPDILSDGFNTDFIQCNLLPYVLEMSEAEYFGRGRLLEKQHLKLTRLPSDQRDLVASTSLARIGGTCARSSLLSLSPRTPVFDHNSPEGS